MSDTVTITITYPAPGTPRDMDAVTSVLIAADPYWRADYSSENTPGQGGGYHRCRRVAGRCGRHCRRSPRRGPRVVDQHQQHPATGTARTVHVRPWFRRKGTRPTSTVTPQREAAPRAPGGSARGGMDTPYGPGVRWGGPIGPRADPGRT
jgi:hypothetical protein